MSPDTTLTCTTTQLIQELSWDSLFKSSVRITFTQRPPSTRHWTNQIERKEPLSFTSWCSADALNDPSATSFSHSSARLEKAVSLTRVAGNCPRPAGRNKANVPAALKQTVESRWRILQGWRKVLCEADSKSDFSPFLPQLAGTERQYFPVRMVGLVVSGLNRPTDAGQKSPKHFFRS